jgi:hypothetical protein
VEPRKAQRAEKVANGGSQEARDWLAIFGNKPEANDEAGMIQQTSYRYMKEEMKEVHLRNEASSEKQREY